MKQGIKVTSFQEKYNQEVSSQSTEQFNRIFHLSFSFPFIIPRDEWRRALEAETNNTEIDLQYTPIQKLNTFFATLNQVPYKVVASLYDKKAKDLKANKNKLLSSENQNNTLIPSSSFTYSDEHAWQRHIFNNMMKHKEVYEMHHHHFPSLVTLSGDEEKIFYYLTLTNLIDPDLNPQAAKSPAYLFAAAKKIAWRIDPKKFDFKILQTIINYSGHLVVQLKNENDKKEQAELATRLFIYNKLINQLLDVNALMNECTNSALYQAIYDERVAINILMPALDQLSNKTDLNLRASHPLLSSDANIVSEMKIIFACHLAGFREQDIKQFSALINQWLFFNKSDQEQIGSNDQTFSAKRSILTLVAYFHYVKLFQKQLIAYRKDLETDKKNNNNETNYNDKIKSPWIDKAIRVAKQELLHDAIAYLEEVIKQESAEIVCCVKLTQPTTCYTFQLSGDFSKMLGCEASKIKELYKDGWTNEASLLAHLFRLMYECVDLNGNSQQVNELLKKLPLPFYIGTDENANKACFTNNSSTEVFNVASGDLFQSLAELNIAFYQVQQSLNSFSYWIQDKTMSRGDLEELLITGKNAFNKILTVRQGEQKNTTLNNYAAKIYAAKIDVAIDQLIKSYQNNIINVISNNKHLIGEEFVASGIYQSLFELAKMMNLTTNLRSSFSPFSIITFFETAYEKGFISNGMTIDLSLYNRYLDYFYSCYADPKLKETPKQEAINFIKKMTERNDHYSYRININSSNYTDLCKHVDVILSVSDEAVDKNNPQVEEFIKETLFKKVLYHLLSAEDATFITICKKFTEQCEDSTQLEGQRLTENRKNVEKNRSQKKFDVLQRFFKLKPPLKNHHELESLFVCNGYDNKNQHSYDDMRQYIEGLIVNKEYADRLKNLFDDYVKKFDGSDSQYYSDLLLVFFDNKLVDQTLREDVLIAYFNQRLLYSLKNVKSYENMTVDPLFIWLAKQYQQNSDPTLLNKIFTSCIHNLYPKGEALYPDLLARLIKVGFLSASKQLYSPICEETLTYLRTKKMDLDVKNKNIHYQYEKAKKDHEDNLMLYRECLEKNKSLRFFTAAEKKKQLNERKIEAKSLSNKSTAIFVEKNAALTEFQKQENEIEAELACLSDKGDCRFAAESFVQNKLAVLSQKVRASQFYNKNENLLPSDRRDDFYFLETLVDFLVTGKSHYPELHGWAEDKPYLFSVTNSFGKAYNDASLTEKSKITMSEKRIKQLMVNISDAYEIDKLAEQLTALYKKHRFSPVLYSMVVMLVDKLEDECLKKNLKTISDNLREDLLFYLLDNPKQYAFYSLYYAEFLSSCCDYWQNCSNQKLIDSSSDSRSSFSSDEKGVYPIWGVVSRVCDRASGQVDSLLKSLPHEIKKFKHHHSGSILEKTANSVLIFFKKMSNSSESIPAVYSSAIKDYQEYCQGVELDDSDQDLTLYEGICKVNNSGASKRNEFFIYTDKMLDSVNQLKVDKYGVLHSSAIDKINEIHKKLTEGSFENDSLTQLGNLLSEFDRLKSTVFNSRENAIIKFAEKSLNIQKSLINIFSSYAETVMNNDNNLVNDFKNRIQAFDVFKTDLTLLHYSFDEIMVILFCLASLDKEKRDEIVTELNKKLTINNIEIDCVNKTYDFWNKMIERVCESDFTLDDDGNKTNRPIRNYQSIAQIVISEMPTYQRYRSQYETTINERKTISSKLRDTGESDKFNKLPANEKCRCLYDAVISLREKVNGSITNGNTQLTLFTEVYDYLKKNSQLTKLNTEILNLCNIYKDKLSCEEKEYLAFEGSLFTGINNHSVLSISLRETHRKNTMDRDSTNLTLAQIKQDAKNSSIDNNCTEAGLQVTHLIESLFGFMRENELKEKHRFLADLIDGVLKKFQSEVNNADVVKQCIVQAFCNHNNGDEVKLFFELFFDSEYVKNLPEISKFLAKGNISSEDSTDNLGEKLKLYYENLQPSVIYNIAVSQFDDHFRQSLKRQTNNQEMIKALNQLSSHYQTLRAKNDNKTGHGFLIPYITNYIFSEPLSKLPEISILSPNSSPTHSFSSPKNEIKQPVCSTTISRQVAFDCLSSSALAVSMARDFDKESANMILHNILDHQIDHQSYMNLIINQFLTASEKEECHEEFLSLVNCIIKIDNGRLLYNTKIFFSSLFKEACQTKKALGIFFKNVPVNDYTKQIKTIKFLRYFEEQPNLKKQIFIHLFESFDSLFPENEKKALLKEVITALSDIDKKGSASFVDDHYANNKTGYYQPIYKSLTIIKSLLALPELTKDQKKSFFINAIDLKRCLDSAKKNVQADDLFGVTIASSVLPRLNIIAEIALLLFSHDSEYATYLNTSTDGQGYPCYQTDLLFKKVTIEATSAMLESLSVEFLKPQEKASIRFLELSRSDSSDEEQKLVSGELCVSRLSF